jgi:hypothetical protein
VIEVALVVAVGETGGDIIVTMGARVVPIFMRLSPRSPWCSLARAIRRRLGPEPGTAGREDVKASIALIPSRHPKSTRNEL